MKKQQGFSLVELLIVVGIIGVISAIAVPAYMAHKDKAHATAALSSLKTVISGATLALDKGETIETYINGIDGDGTPGYIIPKLGTITHSGTNAVDITINGGTNNGKKITYTQGGDLWTCTYEKMTNINALPGCEEASSEADDS